MENKHLERLGEAYHKYSIDPCDKYLKTLQDLTGKKDLPDVFDATSNCVEQATSIEPLQELQTSVDRLHNERSFLLNQRVQKEALSKLPDLRSVTQHLKKLSESVGTRIRQLKDNNGAKKRVELQIFSMCCRRYQEKIQCKQVKVLGPHAYQLANNVEFLKDAKAINQISTIPDPLEKLKFLNDHLSELQDKYLPGKVAQAMLCQLFILAFSHADNPNLLFDIEALDSTLSPQQRGSDVGELLQAAAAAICMIQREALPEIRAELNSTVA
ncbi:MAG: hypothetical protein Q8K75_01115 [Chlamydiales bacterium]|nr:hypothetical protein [Chlamydiales bacterium]